MPVKSPRSAKDWRRAQLSRGVYASWDGSLGLHPDNLFPSQYLLDIDESGNPEGLLRPRPTREDGWNAYATLSGAKRKTLTQQNPYPLPATQPSWEGSQPVINGILPARGEFAARVVRQDAPRVEIEPSGTKGFQNGDYWCGEAYRDRFGRRTTPTGFAKVTLLNGESFRFPAVESVPEGAEFRELLVSRRNRGPETARVQKVVKLDAEGRGEQEVTGPYRARALAASTNATKVHRPAIPKAIREKGAFNLGAGRYRFAAQIQKGRGFSLLSNPTDEVVVTNGVERVPKFRDLASAKPLSPAGDAAFDPATHKKVTVDGNDYIILIDSTTYLAPQKANQPGAVYEVRDLEKPVLFDGIVFVVFDFETVIKGRGKYEARSFENRPVPYKPGRKFSVTPRRLGRNETFIPWVQIDGVWHYAIRVGSVYQYGWGRDSRAFREGVPVYGFTSEDAPDGAPVVLVQSDPPTEDTTGIEAPDPNEAIDPPVPFGALVPVAGDYLAATALTQGERPGVISPTTRYTLDGTQIPRIVPAKRVNRLPNAELSERGSGGNPRGWTIVSNMAGGSSAMDDPEPGVTRLSATAIGNDALSASPYLINNERLAVNLQQPLTVEATLEVSGWSAGSAVAYVREFDAADAQLRDTEIGRVSANGLLTVRRTLLSADFNASTASVSILIGMRGSTKTLTVRVKDMALFPFEARVPKVSFVEGGPDDLDPAPATPHQTGSFFAIGAPKSPPGEMEGEAPKALLTFDSGALPADWALTVTGGGATQQVTTAAALFGTHGWNITDTSNTSSVSRRHIAKQYAAAETNGTSLAIRSLVRVNSRPTRGEVNLLRLDYGTDNTGSAMAFLRIGSQGQLALYGIDSSGTRVETSGFYLSAGEIADVEIVVTGGGTANGQATLLASKNGNPRQVVATISGLDFSIIAPRKVYVGAIGETDGAAKWNFDFDQVAPTDRGDVLSGREGSAPPADVTPPAPDRPARIYPAWAASTTHVAGDERVPTAKNGHYYTASDGTTGTAEPVWPTASGATVTDGTVTWTEAGGIYRESDSKDNLINQGVLFIEPGTEAEDYELTREPIAITPGETYTVAAQGRETVFADDQESPAYPFLVTLHDDEGERVFAGSAYGPTDPTSHQREWTGTDRWNTFTVPEGYTEARVWLWHMRGGVYRFQEPLFARGELTTQEQRDAARGYGRATEGTATLILPTAPPRLDCVPPTAYPMQTEWVGLGVEQANDEGALAVSYRSTNDDPAVVASPLWSEPTNDPSTLQPAGYVEMTLSLSGDGESGPEVAAGGAFLETRHRLGSLLRADGSELPGGAWIAPDPSYSSPEYDTARVSGHAFSAALTEDIHRLPPMTVHVGSESAFRELMERWLDEVTSEIDGIRVPVEWVAEVPHTAHEGREGMKLTLRFSDVPEWEVFDTPYDMVTDAEGNVERKIYAEIQTPEAEVIQAAPLSSLYVESP